jgi:hypothetical protein
MQFQISMENLDTQNPLFTFHQMCFGYLYNDWLMVLSGIFILSQLLLFNVFKGVNKIVLNWSTLTIAYYWYVNLFKRHRRTLCIQAS